MPDENEVNDSPDADVPFHQRPRQDEIDKAITKAMSQMGPMQERGERPSFDLLPRSQKGPMQGGDRGGKMAFEGIQNREDLSQVEKRLICQGIAERISGPHIDLLRASHTEKEEHEAFMTDFARNYESEAKQLYDKHQKDHELAPRTVTDQPFGTGRSTRVNIPDPKSPEGRVDNTIRDTLRFLQGKEGPRQDLLSQELLRGVKPTTISPERRAEEAFGRIERNAELSPAQKQMIYQELASELLHTTPETPEQTIAAGKAFVRAYVSQYGPQSIDELLHEVSVNELLLSQQNEKNKKEIAGLLRPRIPSVSFLERPRQDEIDKAITKAMSQMGPTAGRDSGGKKAFTDIQGREDLSTAEKNLICQGIADRISGPHLETLRYSEREREQRAAFMESFTEGYPEEARQIRTRLSDEALLKAQGRTIFNMNQRLGTGRSTTTSDPKSSEGQVDKAIGRTLRILEGKGALNIPGQLLQSDYMGGAKGGPSLDKVGEEAFKSIELNPELSRAQKQVIYQEIAAELQNPQSTLSVEAGSAFLRAYVNQHGIQAINTLSNVEDEARLSPEPRVPFLERPRQDEVDKAISKAISQMGPTQGRDSGGEKAFSEIEKRKDLSEPERMLIREGIAKRISGPHVETLGYSQREKEQRAAFMAKFAESCPGEFEQLQTKRQEAAFFGASQVTGQPFGTGRSTRVATLDPKSPEGRLDNTIQNTLRSLEGVKGGPPPDKVGEEAFKRIELNPDLSRAQKQMIYQEIATELQNPRANTPENTVAAGKAFLRTYVDKHGDQALDTLNTAQKLVRRANVKNEVKMEASHHSVREQMGLLSGGKSSLKQASHLGQHG